MPSEDKHPAKLPARARPLMLAHLAITGDRPQFLAWRQRLLTIEQAEEVDRARDPETRALLADRAVWSRVRWAGSLGALSGMGVGAAWMAWLVPLYAFGHGFGAWALGFFLPVPIAWRTGRWLWSSLALAGIREHRRRRSLGGRLRALVKNALRGFGAGFGFGFTLVFLQCLMTWFMTPAPTFFAELAIDAYHASLGGLAAGTLGAALGPVLGRAPAKERALTPTPFT